MTQKGHVLDLLLGKIFGLAKAASKEVAKGGLGEGTENGVGCYQVDGGDQRQRCGHA